MSRVLEVVERDKGPLGEFLKNVGQELEVGEKKDVTITVPTMSSVVAQISEVKLAAEAVVVTDPLWQQVGEDIVVTIPYNVNENTISRIVRRDRQRAWKLWRIFSDKKPRIHKINPILEEEILLNGEILFARGTKCRLKFFEKKTLYISKEECLKKSIADGALQLARPECFAIWDVAGHLFPVNTKITFFSEASVVTEHRETEVFNEEGHKTGQVKKTETRWVPHCKVVPVSTESEFLTTFGVTNFDGAYLNGTFAEMCIICVYKVEE